MHDILVDQARRKAAQKRGGDLERASFDEGAVGRALGPELTDVIAVSNALARLRADHPRPASVAMLKTFAGAEDADIAVHHGVTTRTVERDWRFARAYLLRELSR